MDKLTYLAELAEGLARWVPERERQDILRYYAEYFEEAGPDREAEVVRELGDPWALSCRLAVEGGFVTQEQAVAWTPRKKRKWSWMLAVGITAAVLVFTIGSVVSLIGGLFGFLTRTAASETVRQATIVDNGEYTYSFDDETIPGGMIFEGGNFWSTEGGSLEAFAAIDADIGLGNITVVAGDDYTLSIGHSLDLGSYDVTWEVKGGTLKLKDNGTGKQFRVDGWAEFKEMFQDRQGLEVIITVPEGLTLDKISVKTGLGNVMLFDVSAQKMTAETGMGNVECYEARDAQKIDLETGMGNVTLNMEELHDGVEIDLESGMGNVEAFLGCAEWDCEYELKTGLGNVTVDCVARGTKAERKGNYSCKLEAESGMGDVDVYFN